MPLIDDNFINKSKGNFTSEIKSSLNEGQQTVDKVKDIVQGVNEILTKVQGFRQQAKPNQQAPAQNIGQASSTPQDMQKQATLYINEGLLMNSVKEFFKGLPDGFKTKTINETLKELDGNEAIVQSVLVELIKKTTTIKYL